MKLEDVTYRISNKAVIIDKMAVCIGELITNPFSPALPQSIQKDLLRLKNQEDLDFLSTSI